MLGLRKTGAVVALVFCSSIITACAESEPPDEYASVSSKYFQKKGGGLQYNQMIHDADFPKPTFQDHFQRTCSAVIGRRDEFDDVIAAQIYSDWKAAAKINSTSAVITFEQAEADKNYKVAAQQEIMTAECGSGKETSYTCWAFRNRATRRCVDVLLTDTVQQCVEKVGVQNRFFAQANEWIGYTLLPITIAADITAIINAPKTANSATALSAAALANSVETGAGNLQKVAPGNATVKVADLQQSMQSYVVGAGLNDDELNSCISGGPNMDQIATMSPEDARAAEKAIAAKCSPIVLKYARLHDAVFAACSVSAF